MMVFSEEVIRSLGLTLLDSLWQGAVLLVICGAFLWLLRNRASRVRYYVVLLGLLALPVMSIVTFSGYYGSNTSVVATTTGGQIIAGDSILFEGGNVLPDSAIGLVDQWYNWAQLNASYISLIWVLGFALFAFRLTGGFYMVHKLKKNSQLPEDGYWLSRLRLMCEELKIKIPVELRQSAKLTSPIVLGYLKPVVIFPIGLLQGLPTDQIEAILLHELAHIKRFDYVLNIVVSLLQVVFFYHPAYWWLQSQLDSEREYSCDDLVLNQTGNSLSLIKALAAVREFQITSHSPALAFAGQKNQLLKRVERIMKKKTRTNWLGGLISMSVLLISFFLMSYQSKQTGQDIKKADVPAIDSIKPVKISYDTLEIMSETDSVKFSTLQWRTKTTLSPDTVSLEQAILDLLDPEKNNLFLVTDKSGVLVSIKKNGKTLEGDDLKVYKSAHARLKQYARNEVSLNEAMRKLEIELNESEQAIDELRSKERALKEELVESEVSYTRLRTLEEYERSVKELRDRVAENNDREKSELVEDLRTKEKALYEYVQFIKRYERIKSESGELSKRRNEVENQRTRDLLIEYEALVKELRTRNVISPSRFEFSGKPAGQKMAVWQIDKHNLSQEKPLIVVDDKVQKDWSFADLDKIDASRKIVSMDIRKADIPEEYEKLMKNRDVFVRIVTSPGGKDYKRPEIELAQNSYSELSEREREETFSKAMIETLENDQLITANWKTLELSTEALLINNKKQPKKVLKKYLKLYEQVTGKPLAKGKTIELQE